MLAREGVLSPEFMSIEEYLGRNTQRYYDVLADVGQGSWRPGKDARPWIRFTITAHLRQARTMLFLIRETERLWLRLEQRLREERLPERTLVPLLDAGLGLRMRNAPYRATLEDTIAEPTASKDLQRIVEAGLLVPSGEKRGRFYRASADLGQVRQENIASRDPRTDRDPFAE